MNDFDRIKIQKIILRIESGKFDELDIDNFFMKLRAYSQNCKIFREIADFIAHNDERDKGIVNESLEAFYFSMKFFVEYISPKILLDMSKPFPLYIKKLMKYQINKCKEIELINKFKLNKIKLKSKIDNLFLEKRKENYALLRNIKISKQDSKIINYLLGFIGSIPAFEQKDLITDIFKTMDLNQLNYIEKEFLENIDKVIICILLLLNNSKFIDIDKDNLGYSKISCEQEYIPYNLKFVDIDGNVIIKEHSFGFLQINGYVHIKKEDGIDLEISYPLLITTLEAEKWCDERLFFIEPLNKETSSILYKKIKFNNKLILSDNFRISVST